MWCKTNAEVRTMSPKPPLLPPMCMLYGEATKQKRKHVYAVCRQTKNVTMTLQIRALIFIFIKKQKNSKTHSERTNK